MEQRFQPATSWLDLFDWKFEKYLTRWIVRATWIACLVLAAVWSVLILLGTFAVWMPEPDFSQTSIPQQSFPQTGSPRSDIEPSYPTISPLLIARITTTATLLSTLVVVGIILLWIRVFLESVIVLYNIAATLTTIDKKFDDRPS